MFLTFLPSFVQNVIGQLITHHANQLPTPLLKILRINSLNQRKLQSHLGSQTMPIRPLQVPDLYF